MGKIFILLSDKRSGSTMFQDEMCKHPDLQHVKYSPHTHFETHHWLKGAVLLGMPPETFSGGHTYPGYGSKANAKAYLIDCVLKNVPDFTIPEDDRELVFNGWEALCDKFAKPIFFEKSPQYLANWASLSLMLEWISRTKHEVKVITLTRNPLSVQYSAQKLFHTDASRRQFGWLDIHKNLLAFEAQLDSGSFLRVKYEDIIRSPIQEFTAIQHFLGIDENAASGNRVHGQSIEKWKDDPNFNLALDETVVQMARYLGYTDADLFNPRGLKASRQQRISQHLRRESNLLRVRLIDRLIKPVLMRLKRLGK
jgi:hypothetical protein